MKPFELFNAAHRGQLLNGLLEPITDGVEARLLYGAVELNHAVCVLFCFGFFVFQFIIIFGV